jgi:hypothetical protein
MASVDDLDQVLEQFKQAGNAFMKGNPKPVQDLFSHRDDVTLANPFGPHAGGMRLPRPRSVAHPIIETARSTPSRPWGSTCPPSLPASCG